MPNTMYFPGNRLSFMSLLSLTTKTPLWICYSRITNKTYLPGIKCRCKRFYCSMAQLLVCAVPNPGHVFPMMTVSRHLVAAGHKIIFYTAEIFRSKIEACGFEFASLPGKANYNYLRPDWYCPERDSVPLGSPEWTKLMARSIFSETLVDQYRGLERIHHPRYTCRNSKREPVSLRKNVQAEHGRVTDDICGTDQDR